MIICYTVPEIWCMMDVIIFHFRLFFALLPHYLPKKPIFFQKCQKQLEIPSFYTHVPKLMIRWCMVPEIVHDGWKKWHVSMWVPHLKIICKLLLFAVAFHEWNKNRLLLLYKVTHVCYLRTKGPSTSGFHYFQVNFVH